MSTDLNATASRDYPYSFVSIMRSVCARIMPGTTSVTTGSTGVRQDVIGIIPRMPDRRTPVARATAVHVDPRGAAARAFQVVADKLGSDRRILITADRPGAGASVCATNLALALASRGRSVLLVDANVKRPAQDVNLHVPAGRGWSDANAAGIARFLIQATDVEQLKVLPAGSKKSASLDTLMTLLDSIGDEFDHVVIDGPENCDAAGFDMVLDVSRCRDHTVIARRTA